MQPKACRSQINIGTYSFSPANTQLSILRRKFATQPLPNAKKLLSFCSISNVSTSDKNTSGVSYNFRAGSSKPASERGNMRGSLYKKCFYSRSFLIPKKDGSMRSVIDLSPLNCFIETPHFQTEHLTTVKSLLKQFKQAHFMTKLDLKDAYLSMAITGYTSSE